jgi:hypothetical protein
MSVCRPYHDQIQAHLWRGTTVPDIHYDLGIPCHVENLRQYIKHNFPKSDWPPKKTNNQYTTTGRCKQGHLFTKESTAWVSNGRGSITRRCKICRRLRYLHRGRTSASVRRRLAVQTRHKGGGGTLLPVVILPPVT